MVPPSESTKLEACGGFADYVGANKLKDKKVIITGGEYESRSFSSLHVSMGMLSTADKQDSSGIGRAVAVLMAKEGADITIVYLPQEQEDADDTKKMVESEGRTCNLFAGDLREHSTCQKAVEEHVKK